MLRNKKGQFIGEEMKGNTFAKGNKPNKTSFKKGKRKSPETEFKKGIHPKTEFKRGHKGYWNGKRGKEHPSWKGGLTSNLYSENWTKTLRQSIRERDKYICQLCFQYGNTIHHIDYCKQNCSLDNLITLCKKCNSKVNFNRNIWKLILRQQMFLIEFGRLIHQRKTEL